LFLSVDGSVSDAVPSYPTALISSGAVSLGLPIVDLPMLLKVQMLPQSTEMYYWRRAVV
jgi:hypothetical protein